MHYCNTHSFFKKTNKRQPCTLVNSLIRCQLFFDSLQYTLAENVDHLVLKLLILLLIQKLTHKITQQYPYLFFRVQVDNQTTQNNQNHQCNQNNQKSF